MFERQLKLTHNDSHRVYFTSDTHFRHNQSFIFESRGYKDRYEHDDDLIAKINEVVRPQDTLIHLGDFCLNITPPEFDAILNRINCQNIMYIWGNHNSCIRRHYEDAVAGHLNLVRFSGNNPNDGIEVYPYTIGKLTYLGYYKELIVNGHMIVIHHYPIYSWNSMRKGSWCLHGHEHCAVTDHLPDGDGGKILDVGWDYYKSPVSFNEIQKIMHKKQIKSIGHH
jgi:calcineurin-like phosphoesterase family protein